MCGGKVAAIHANVANCSSFSKAQIAGSAIIKFRKSEIPLRYVQNVIAIPCDYEFSLSLSSEELMRRFPAPRIAPVAFFFQDLLFSEIRVLEEDIGWLPAQTS